MIQGDGCLRVSCDDRRGEIGGDDDGDIRFTPIDCSTGTGFVRCDCDLQQFRQ